MKRRSLLLGLGGILLLLGSLVGGGGPPARAYDAGPASGAGGRPGVESYLANNTMNACALTATGKRTCWGRNDDGQNDVPAGTYTAVSATGGSTCGLHADGTLACWAAPMRGKPTRRPGSTPL